MDDTLVLLEHLPPFHRLMWATPQSRLPAQDPPLAIVLHLEHTTLKGSAHPAIREGSGSGAAIPMLP